MANERIALTVRANCKDIIVALWRVQSGLMDLLPVAPSVPDAPDAKWATAMKYASQHVKDVADGRFSS